MIEVKDKARCSGCYACVTACPRKCLHMVEDEEGFAYPQVDLSVCNDCGVCEKVCPICNGYSSAKEKEENVSYSAYNRNEDIRLKSSSGGVFTELAQWVIKQSGIVFGAAFDEEFRVKHIEVDTVDGLERLRGSKYVQSSIGDAYYKVKEYLLQSKLVLFSGTPCQVSGLYSYLNKEYANLLTVDFICHGVPSPAVWKEYVRYREAVAGADAVAISFRDKTSGWKSFSMSFRFERNNPSYIKKLSQDEYMRAFLTDLCLRPSCYECQFKGLNRMSDITLADFWGIQNIAPEMDDDKGTSLVVLNSVNGVSVFNEIQEQLVYKEVELEEAIRYNPAMIESPQRPKKRVEFMREIHNHTFDVLLKKYTHECFVRRLYHKLKRILKKIIRI